MNKQALRAKLRATRDAFATVRFPATFEPFIDCLTPATIVASYIAVGRECDPTRFVDAARAVGCRLALPHVTSRARPMRFLAWRSDAQLVAGPFGLSQPAATQPELAPDIVLTPLLGFDRRGNRLGQGAGYYDRAFAVHPYAWRIGLAWSVQEVEALTPDAWDIPLHAIVTEKEWIEP